MAGITILAMSSAAVGKDVVPDEARTRDMMRCQDYLQLDNSARINQPSTLGTNWKWRLKKGELTEELKAEIWGMTRRYGRLNG